MAAGSLWFPRITLFQADELIVWRRLLATSYTRTRTPERGQGPSMREKIALHQVERMHFAASISRNEIRGPWLDLWAADPHGFLWFWASRCETLQRRPTARNPDA